MLYGIIIKSYCDIRETFLREIVTCFAASNQNFSGHTFKDKSELKTAVS